MTSLASFFYKFTFYQPITVSFQAELFGLCVCICTCLRGQLCYVCAINVNCVNVDDLRALCNFICCCYQDYTTKISEVVVTRKQGTHTVEMYL